MRLLKTELRPLTNDLMKIDLRNQPFLASPFHAQPAFHAHPELELVLIIEGFGKRIIGNTIEPFEAGDMVFIGSNVPHIWLSDPVFYEHDSMLRSKAIVTHLNAKVIFNLVNLISEFQHIRDMVRQSSKGIRIFGDTRDKISDKLIKLADLEGFDKVEEILRIMNLISISKETSFIINEDQKYFEDPYSDKLVDVVKFMKTNLHHQIKLAQVADIACMTEQSFCRFFKKRVKKNFSQFLNELRISQARELLIQTDKTVNDIAYLCGFKSCSHFCYVFKGQSGQSPVQYKSSMKQEIV